MIMKTFMVIVNLNQKEYLTKVQANSHLDAEHLILDSGITGKFECAVSACMAYDFSEMETECFRTSALYAELITLENLLELIEERNAVIKRNEELKIMIDKFEKQKKEIEKAIEESKRMLEESKCAS